MRSKATVALLIAPIAQAGVVPAYSNWDGMDDVGSSVFQVHEAPRRVGLTFESERTGELVSASVALSMSGFAPRGVGVEVWTLDASGLPSAVIALGLNTVAGSGGVSTQSFDLAFQATATLHAGQSYAVVLFNSSGPSFDWSTTTTLPQGDIVSMLPNGEWKSTPSADAGGMPAVRINVVPAPGGLAFFTVLGAALRRRRA